MEGGESCDSADVDLAVGGAVAIGVGREHGTEEGRRAGTEDVDGKHALLSKLVPSFKSAKSLKKPKARRRMRGELWGIIGLLGDGSSISIGAGVRSGRK